MLKPFSFDYFGSVITATSLGTGFKPLETEVITAACVPLTDDNKVVAVEVIGRGVDIPGGHIDEGETAVEAMRRESFEEASIKVSTPLLIDVLKVASEDKKLGLDKKPYMLIYAARVTELQDFIANDEVSERLILTPGEFVMRYFADHEYANEMVNAASKVV